MTMATELDRDLDSLIAEMNAPEYLAEARRQVEEIRAVLRRMAQRRIEQDCERAMAMVEGRKS